MLWTVVVILLLLWLFGFSLAGMGSLVHILLAIAVIFVVIQLLNGRRIN